jgi:hypothetical protein
MHLTKITAANVKGRDFDLPLKPLTLILGDNTAGKSAIRDAIMIAMLGRHPELGATPGALMALAGPGNPGMSIVWQASEPRIGGGTYLRRKGEKCSKETDGDSPPPMLEAQLDFDTFRQAKGTERQRVLETLMSEADPEQDSKDRQTAVELIATQAVELTPAKDSKWLATLEADAAELARTAKQSADTAAKALADLMVRPEPTAIPSDAQLAEAQARVETAASANGAAHSRWDALQERIMNAPEQPDEADGKPLGPEAFALFSENTTAKIEAITGELATAKAAAAKVGAIRVARTELMRSEYATGTGKRDAELGDAWPDIAKAKADLNVCEQGHRAANEDAKEADRAVARGEAAQRARHDELAALLQEDGPCECPTCHTKGEALQAAVRALMDAERPIQEEMMAKLVKIAEGARADERVAASKLADAREFLNRVEGHARWMTQRQLADMERQIIEAERENQTDPLSLQTRIDTLRMNLRNQAAIQTAWDAFTNYRHPTQAEIEKARTDVVETGDKQNRARTMLAAMQADADAAAAARQDRKRQVELAAERDAAERISKAAKAVGGWAKEQQRQRAAAALAALTGPANEALAGLGLGTLAVEGTTVGITANGTVRPLEVLSGSEAAAVAAAFQAAMASRAEIGMVVVDELSRFTPERKRTFLGNLARMVEAGTIKQAIAIDYDTTLNASEIEGYGWHTITVEGTPTAD